MSKFKVLLLRMRFFAAASCLGLGLAAMIVPVILLAGQDPAPPSKTNSPPSATNSVASSSQPADKTKPAPRKKQLTGAELYSIHCNRCHPERYPTERTAAQWKTILLHMQVRANLPVQQARQILKYLQENSGR